MTNREWIETFDDDALYEILVTHFQDLSAPCVMCVYEKDDCRAIKHDCADGFIKWLNAEHEE